MTQLPDLVLSVVDPGCGYINANHRMHWTKRAHTTKAWREAAAWTAKGARVPSFTRVRIVAVPRFKDQRRRDLHNLFPTLKACVDGLVDAGLIPDDSREHLVGPDFRDGPPVPRGGRLRVDLFIFDLSAATEETA